MQGDNSEKSQGFRENKRRRTQSKFNKQVPRYQCFCSKQYLSYPALYLHLKNKHNQYFQCSKNGKRVETTKLTQSFDSAEGYKVFKISFDPTLNPADNQKKDNLISNGKVFQNSFPENQLFFPTGNYMSYPYQPYFDYMLPNMNDYNRRIYPKDVAIQTAFEMFIQNQTTRGAKEKLEIQLFLALIIQCLNQNYYVLKDERVGEKECRRYTAQYNSKLLSDILQFFQQHFLANIKKDVDNKSYNFFVTNSTLMSTSNYKKIFQQLLEFINSPKQEVSPDKIMQNKILSYPSIDKEQNMEYDQADQEELDSEGQLSEELQQKNVHHANIGPTAINLQVEQSSRSNLNSEPNQASEQAGTESKALFKASKS